VVDVVQVVVRVVVEGSGILGTLKGLRVDGGVCTIFDPFTKEENQRFHNKVLALLLFVICVNT
jgi:hypothetical protein